MQDGALDADVHVQLAEALVLFARKCLSARRGGEDREEVEGSAKAAVREARKSLKEGLRIEPSHPVAARVSGWLRQCAASVDGDNNI